MFDEATAVIPGGVNSGQRRIPGLEQLVVVEVFELPLNLKRSHTSHAHSDADIDHLLEATEASVRKVMEDR